jgi:aquaporin TIP
VLTLIVPAAAQGPLGTHGLAARVTVAGGLLTEVLLTLVLVSAVLATTRGAVRSAPLGCLTIGLSATVGYLFGTAITGGSMNPARSFGPALVAGVWTDHWIFWVGPFVGAAVAGFVYEFCFSEEGRHDWDWLEPSESVTAIGMALAVVAAVVNRNRHLTVIRPKYRP